MARIIRRSNRENGGNIELIEKTLSDLSLAYEIELEADGQVITLCMINEETANKMFDQLEHDVIHIEGR